MSCRESGYERGLLWYCIIRLPTGVDYTPGRRKIVPHKCNHFTTLRMAYKESDYIVVVASYHAVTQAYNFGAETHLGGGDTSAFVMPSATIARMLSTFVGSTALRKGSRRL